LIDLRSGFVGLVVGMRVRRACAMRHSTPKMDAKDGRTPHRPAVLRFLNTFATASVDGTFQFPPAQMIGRTHW